MPPSDIEGAAATAAWDEPAVRDAWRAHVRRSRAQALVAVLVLGTAAGLFALVDRNDDAFRREAVSATATVTGSDAGGRRSVDKVYVTYTVGDTSYRSTLNDEPPDDHPRGSRVAILYDPDFPRTIRTSSNPNHEPALDAILAGITLLGVVLLALGAFGGTSALRWRRRLRSHGAQHVHLVEGTLPRLVGDDAYVLRITRSRDAPLDVVARLTGSRRWLDGWPFVGGPPDGLGGPAMACHGSRRHLIVFDPDVQVPVEVAVPWRARTARRWMQRFRPHADG
jgi:hypothetical protein